jgi:hypothetical protein
MAGVVVDRAAVKQRLSKPLPRARVGRLHRPAAPKPGAGAPHAAAVDLAVEKVREAGGPVDRAAYGCACGCNFRAHVSTTVSCPRCGAAQAW